MNKPTTVLTLQKNIDIFFQASYLKYLVNIICFPHRRRFTCFSERVRFRNHTCVSLRWRMPIEKIQFFLTEFKNLSCFDLIIHIKKTQNGQNMLSFIWQSYTTNGKKWNNFYIYNITYLLNYNIIILTEKIFIIYILAGSSYFAICMLIIYINKIQQNPLRFSLLMPPSLVNPSSTPY